MPTNDLDELKKLSPKERLQKLKELQKKKEEEIKAAQKLMAESEEEAKIEEELEKIPIPQLKAVDIDSLFTEEEKELFREKRFETKKSKKVEEAEEKKGELEKSLEGVEVKHKEAENQAQIQYIHRLSQEPADKLYNRMKSLYEKFNEEGMLTRSEWEEINQISYANREKLEAIEAHKYTDVSQEAAREMVLTEKMKNWMQSKYRT